LCANLPPAARRCFAALVAASPLYGEGENVMAKEKTFGLTLQEIDDIADQLNKKVDTNHPVGDGSWSSFIKAFDEGSKKLHQNKAFMEAFNINRNNNRAIAGNAQ
jgi:hypothetical protein